MTQLKVGVIGCGYWGPNLIRNFVELGQADVVAVADLSPERLGHILSRYPSIQGTHDYHTFFEMDLDAAVVATPPATHIRLAGECLAHGLHTFVEKPLALSSADGQMLVDAADERGLVLMVGHTFEYNPAVRALKEIMDSGELGEIYSIDSVRASLGLFQADLNVLWDLAPHDVSILRYLLGADPLRVSAQGADQVFKGKHDLVYMTMLFPGDVLAHVQVSWLHPSKVRRITVVGSKKMVVYDDVETIEKIKIYDKGVDTLPYTDSYGEFQCSYRYGDVLIPNIRFSEPLRIECEHFCDCITNHREPQSSGRVGLKVVEVLEMAQQSLLNGGTFEAFAGEEN